jgi:hypothetical protein
MSNSNNSLRPTPLNPIDSDNAMPEHDFNNPPKVHKIDQPDDFTLFAGCVMSQYLTADSVVRYTNSRAGAAYMQTINAVFRMVDLKGPFESFDQLMAFMQQGHLFHCSMATYERLHEVARGNPGAEAFASLLKHVPKPGPDTMSYWEDLSDDLSVFFGTEWVNAYERKLYFLWRDMESIRIVLDRFLRDKHQCDHLDFHLTRKYPRPMGNNNDNTNNDTPSNESN